MATATHRPPTASRNNSPTLKLLDDQAALLRCLEQLQQESNVKSDQLRRVVIWAPFLWFMMALGLAGAGFLVAVTIGVIGA